MNWESFKNWIIGIGQSISGWFMGIDEDGLSPLTRMVIAICVLIVGRILIKLLMKLLRKIFGVSNKIGVDVSVKTFSLSVVNVILNIILAIVVLALLKVDFTAVSSVLSAGTVAIGLSLQDLISAFASGVVLLKTKHFKTGDYIHIQHSDGSCEGTVSSVVLIATTMETFGKQHIIIPNNKLVQGTITNYSTNPTRRLVFNVSVDYDTDVALCKQVIQEVIEKDARILKDPKPSIVVSDLGEYSITFSIRGYIKLRDYWDVYFAIREQILLAFRERGIRIPFKRVVVEDYQMSRERINASISTIEK